MRDDLVQPIGEGVPVLCQADAERAPQSVVVTLEGLRATVAAHQEA